MRVGFIGLGSQGGPMARRIVESGYELTLWARRPESLEPYADTAAKTLCQMSCACRSAFDLSDIVTFFRPAARACSNAARTMRSTPLRVFTSSWIPISSAVPFLKIPPTPAYAPSVFSRNTTKSTSSAR